MTPDDLVTRHAPWAKSIADRICVAQPFERWIERDDLRQAALIGLWQAATRWDGQRDFRRFAQRRVKGAVCDELRIYYGGRHAGPKQRLTMAVNGHGGLCDWLGDELFASDEPSPEAALMLEQTAWAMLATSLSRAEGAMLRGRARGALLRDLGAQHERSEAWACKAWASAREKIARAA